MKYVVELENNCWIAEWEGDPGRTIVHTNAQKFDSIDDAKEALAKARQYRNFIDAIIYPYIEKVFKVKIIGFDNPNRWYKDFVGSVFTVSSNDGDLPSYVVNGMLSEHESVYRIQKEDCELV